jgi:hypothetical protein
VSERPARKDLIGPDLMSISWTHESVRVDYMVLLA